MAEPYPDIRTRAAPHFLTEKYGKIVGLLNEVAERGRHEGLVPFDKGHFTREFPTFQAAFESDTDRLEKAFGGFDDAARRYRTFLQRLMLWKDLDEVRDILGTLFDRKIADMPRTLDDIEQTNKRDILDPFIVAFTSRLLHAGSLKYLIRSLVVHKCMMKVEDLIGHLHGEVLGRAAGGECVPEPQGMEGNKEDWHPTLNPYPGADARRGQEEFYQIKNKTGSAKGSDGEKLGRQFLILKKQYPDCQRFYVSLIGRTLKGHRSMGAFLRKDEEAEVLVGVAAFQQLGRHRDTADIVLELYLEEFEAALERNHYDFDRIVDDITKEWLEKHGEGDPAFRLLHDSITPDDPHEQVASLYMQKKTH